MQQIYRHDFIVSEESIDGNGHVNNLEYLHWMQDAAIDHSDSQGCTELTEAAGATWVVRSHHIEYFRPAYAGDLVSVWTWVANFRRVQSLRKYRIVRLPDNTLLAEGESDWVFIDAVKGKPRAIPKEVIAAFEIVPAEKEAEIIAQFGTLTAKANQK
jgi:acyl-CoA thioester hydrolase